MGSEKMPSVWMMVETDGRLDMEFLREKPDAEMEEIYAPTRVVEYVPLDRLEKAVLASFESFRAKVREMREALEKELSQNAGAKCEYWEGYRDSHKGIVKRLAEVDEMLK